MGGPVPYLMMCLIYTMMIFVSSNFHIRSINFDAAGCRKNPDGIFPACDVPDVQGTVSTRNAYNILMELLQQRIAVTGFGTKAGK